MESIDLSVENNDALGLRSLKSITKQLEKGEVVLFSCEVNKHNKRGVLQKRSLLLTNKYLYNINFTDTTAQLLSFLVSSSVIKRKIALESIAAITLSTYYLSDQLIFHVPTEYDYRYSGLGKKREALVKLLCREYFENTKKKMNFFFKDAPDLSSYQTTDEDQKAGVSKMPKEEAVILSYEDLEKGLEKPQKGDEKQREEKKLSSQWSPRNDFFLNKPKSDRFNDT